MAPQNEIFPTDTEKADISQVTLSDDKKTVAAPLRQFDHDTETAAQLAGKEDEALKLLGYNGEIVTFVSAQDDARLVRMIDRKYVVSFNTPTVDLIAFFLSIMPIMFVIYFLQRRRFPLISKKI